MDALSELLRVIRLSGTAFIDADLYAPWAVETPPPSAIAARLAPGAGRIIPYHLVTEGACHVKLTAHTPVELEAGQVIMFPHGDVHVLASTPGLKPMQITTDAVLKLTRPDSIARVRYGGNGARTRLICGFFACDEVLSEQLVARLPRLMHCKIGADRGAALLSRSVQPSRAAAQLGLGAVLGKLSELLFVDAIRAYVESMSQHEGWLTGLKDRYVSRGLALMYGRPANIGQWSRLQGKSASRGPRWRTILCGARGWHRCSTCRSGACVSQPMDSGTQIERSSSLPKLRGSDRLRRSPAPSGASSVFRRTGGGEISVAASVPIPRTLRLPSPSTTALSQSPAAVHGIEKTSIQCLPLPDLGTHLKLELVRLHPDWCADIHSSHQKYDINGDGLDGYATMAKVRATMVGIATDPRGDGGQPRIPPDLLNPTIAATIAALTRITAPIPMSTIAAAVFDAVAALPGRGCTMREVIKALPDIDRDRVTSAVHRSIFQS